ADFFAHPLLTARRASAPAHVLGVPLALLFPCHAEQPFHPLRFQHVVNSLHERRFVGDLTLPSTSRRRQGSELCLRMGQPCFSTRRLSGGMNRRPHHQHPFAPCLCADLRTTGPFKLIALGHEPLLTTVIDAENPFQLTGLGFRHPLCDPCVHGLSRRPYERQRRQVQVVVPHNV